MHVCFCSNVIDVFSNSTSWEAPPGSVQIPIGAESATNTTTTTTQHHGRTKTQLPSGWSKDVDAEGNSYYYSTTDGTCAWDFR